MAATIQTIETPKRWRAWDTSTSYQEIGQERVTNGGFANWSSSSVNPNPDNWTVHNEDANNHINEAGGGGAAVYVSNDSADLYITQNNVFQVGKTYRFKMDCTAHTAGSVGLWHNYEGEGVLASLSGTGSIDHIFTATGTSLTINQTGASVNLTFDNVSVKEVKTFSNNNHGQIYSGRGLEFDGVSDYLNSVTTFPKVDNVTVAFWMNRDEFDGSAKGLVGRATGSGNGGGQWSLWLASDAIRGYISDGSGTGPYEYFVLASSNIPINTWYRVVVTFDFSSAKSYAYVNGVNISTWVSNETSTATIGSTVDSTAKEIFLGALTAGTSANYYAGKMSDFQYWDATWTSDDVAFDYANPEQLALNRGGTSLTESNLKLWYPMNDGHRGQQSYVLDASNTGLGDELVEGGTSLSASDWDRVDSPWTFSNGVASCDGSQGGDVEVYQNAGAAINTSFKVVIEMTRSAGTLQVNVGGYDSYSMTSSGTHTFYITSDTSTGSQNGRIYFIGNSTFEGTVSSISAKPVNDKNHATTVFYGDELITEAKNQEFTGTPDWALHDPQGGSAAGVSVVGGKLQVVTTTDAEIEGAKLPVANLTAPVVGRTYRFSASLDSTSGDTTPTIIVSFGGGTASNGISTTEAVHNFDIVAANTTGDLLVYTDSSTAATFTIENASVKEEGTATGWTDADQQLDIPQTALQSYNQLAWFDGYNDKVAVTEFNFEDGHSINMWALINDTSTGSRDFFGLSGGTENYMRIDSSNPTEKFQFEADDNTPMLIDLGDAGVIPEGEWVMWTWLWNADRTISVYKNGELLASSSATADSAEGTRLKIDSFGNAQAATTNMQGAITEISHYTDLLTQAEINDLYNDGKAKDAREASGNGGLSGYWKNNGLATWTDLQGSNNGTVTCSETILQQAGVDAERDCQGFLMNRQKDTNALNLCTNLIASGIDNGPHVDVQGPIELGTTPFSMTMWLKKYRDWHEQWILSQYVSDTKRWYLRANNANPPRFQFYARAGSADTSINISNSAFDLDANGLDTWIHFGLTTNRSNSFKWYINGSLVDTDTSLGAQGSQSPDDNLSNGANLTIGWNEDANFDDHHFDGEIDDVMIYTNKEMSAAEIKRNYNAGKRSHR